MYRLLFVPSILLIMPVLCNLEPAFGSNVPTSKNTNVKLEMNAPICYMQTLDGTIVDLSKTCGFISPSICADSLGTSERNAVLLEFCRKNEKCELTSTCDQMPRSINAPPPGIPAGMGFPIEVDNDSSTYAVPQKRDVA